MNHYEEPPYTKEWSKEMKVEKDRLWRCKDLDEASRWDTWENLELWKIKDEQLRIGNLISWTTSGRRIETTLMNKNKNYVMLILHQVKLMTSNGFGIWLILLEKIEARKEHKLEEVLNEPPVGIETNGNTWEWRDQDFPTRNLNKTLE